MAANVISYPLKSNSGVLEIGITISVVNFSESGLSLKIELIDSNKNVKKNINADGKLRSDLVRSYE
jgi:hypothetical protein